MNLVPVVIEQTTRGERAYDIYSRLLMDRIILISSPIDEQVATSVIAQMLFLENEDPEADITLYINTVGGAVTAGLAIYDTMQFIKPDVSTWCIGQAFSLGALLLAAGAPGKRYALPHSTILIHQPIGGVHGSATDVSIHAREILRIKKEICEILAKHTGQPLEKIEADVERDFFMTSEQAREYGIVDHVVSSRLDIAKEGSE